MSSKEVTGIVIVSLLLYTAILKRIIEYDFNKNPGKYFLIIQNKAYAENPMAWLEISERYCE